MASLALGFIGTAIGGPFGGFIGSFIGSQIDGLIFGGNKTQEGPRLTDLHVTSSAYGQGIPVLYGTIRVSGNIIWSTGLIEKRVKQKTGGKGGKGPSVNLYYYYHCSAAALCGNEILGVNRIWGASKLISKSAYDSTLAEQPATGFVDFSTQPLNGDIISINGHFYTFVNTLISAEQIKIGANLQQTVENLVAAINTGRMNKPNGTVQTIGAGTQYGTGTTRNGDVTAGINATRLTLVAGARDDTFQQVGPVGADGNGVTISTSVTGVVLSGSTLSGGITGSYTDDASAIAALATRFVTETTRGQGEPSSAQVAGNDGVLRILEGGGLVPNTSGALPETIYRGTEDQMPNSLMESFLGVGNVPGYRGLAMCVFNFQPLRDFGNGIPNYTFEVVAHRSITTGQIINDIMLRGGYTADQFDTTECVENVEGYAIARNMSPRDAVNPLLMIYGIDVVEVNGVIRFRKRSGQTMGLVTLTEGDLAAYAYGDQRPEPLTIETMPDSELPICVSLTFIDPARDYQENTVSSFRLTPQSSSVINYTVPITMSADRAQQACEELQYRLWQERRTYTFSTAWDKLNTIQPGNNIAINYRNRTHFMALTKLTVRQPGLLEWTGRAESTSVYKSNATGDSGSIPEQILDIPGDSALYMLDIPLLGDQEGDPGFYWGGKTWGSWRGAALFESTDGGTEFGNVDSINEEASVGFASTVLATYPNGVTMYDRGNSVYVIMDEGELESVSEQAALMNDNNAMLGDELIGFSTATLVDPAAWSPSTVYTPGDVVKATTPHTSYFRCETGGTSQLLEPSWSARGSQTIETDGVVWRTVPTNYYRLSGLVRGRRGTEWAMGTHAKNERFVLLNGTWLNRFPQNVNEIGITRQWKIVPTGLAQEDQTDQDFTNTGVSSKPYAPVHMRARRAVVGNDLTLTWHRRTRIGGGWSDGIDAPLGEASESYDVEIMSGASVVRTVNVTTESFVYTAAMQSADGISTAATTSHFRVYQRSANVGRGYVADATVNIKLT